MCRLDHRLRRSRIEFRFSIRDYSRQRHERDHNDHADSYTESFANAHTYTDSYANADANAYTDADSHSYSDRHNDQPDR